MDNEEDIFEDLDDEIVSADDTQEILEEQPEEDVPSNSNKGSFINGVRSARDFSKNNKSTIDRLNTAKSKNQTTPTAGIGKNIGNKLAGRSEEEKSGIEKKADAVAGKAAGAAITAATGGAVNGAIANELGDMAVQLAKKKLRRYMVIGGVIVAIIFLFILMLVANDDDESEKSTEQLNTYITGNMTNNELGKYLKYIGVCGDSEDDSESEENEEKADCSYAKKYFKKIKKQYEEFKKDCPANPTINNPCGIELNTTLLHETLSYGKTNDELWNKKATPNQEQDIEDLSNAMVEYVHESCYVNIVRYRNKNGIIQNTDCEGCVKVEIKENRNLYYFQISFDKYISFLKYGTSSTHPYYQSNQPVLFGENYDHECIGTNSSSFLSGSEVSNDDNNNIKIDVNSSRYCSDVYCDNDECVAGCKQKQSACSSNTCNSIPSTSTAYTSCMNSCMK